MSLFSQQTRTEIHIPDDTIVRLQVHLIRDEEGCRDHDILKLRIAGKPTVLIYGVVGAFAGIDEIPVIKGRST